MKALRATIVAALLIPPAACSVLPQRPPAAAVHDLGQPQGNHEAAPWQHVDVSQPQWLQNSAIHYRFQFAEPTRLRSYARDQWVASPAGMLSARLNSASAPQGRYRVHLDVLAFEQDFTAPGQAYAYLRARARAAPVGSGPVRTKIFALRKQPVDANAQGAITGLAQLADKLDGTLRAWLNRKGQ